MREDLGDEDRDIDVRRDFLGHVIGEINPALFCQGEDDQILRAVAIQLAQLDRQHEILGAEVELQGFKFLRRVFGVALQVHLRHEELHPHVDIALQRGLGAFGKLIAFAAQEFGQTVGLLGRKHLDVIRADRKFTLDGDAKRAGTLIAFAFGWFVRGGLNHHFVFDDRLTGVGIEILHQPWRGVAVKMGDGVGGDGGHLIAVQDLGRRHDHREFGGAAFVVRRHGDDGGVAGSGVHDHRALVVKFAIGAGDIEATEGICGGRA